MTCRARHILLLAAFLCCADARAQFDRDWKVYLVPYSHIDVGYTAPVDQVLDDHVRYLDQVVDLIESTQGNDPSTSFRWTVEIPWVLEAYLNRATPVRAARFMEHVRAGHIEIGALYFGIQADMAGPEDLARALYYTGALRRDYGVPVRTAVLNDTPGATWGLASLLAGSDIPYLALGMNSALSEFYQTTTLPYLFYWEAPTGERTLVWRPIDRQWAYLEGAIAVGAYSSYATFEQRLTALLHRLEKEGYPYDAILLNAATGDNGAPNGQILANARQWNTAHGGSRVIVSTFGAFFDAVTAAFGDRIPAFRGDLPNWWSWAFATSATGGFQRLRAVQQALPDAEKLAAVAASVSPGFAYPAGAIRRAYRNVGYYEDHNLGGKDPSGDAPFWLHKMGWIEAARFTADSVAADALDAWSGRIATGAGLTVAVFNTTGWMRTDVATLPAGILAAGEAVEVTDVATAAPVPTQVLSDGDVVFLAQDVPSLGYRTFRLRRVPAEARPWQGTVLEDAHYRVAFDPATGAVSSLIDRAQGRDLVRPGGRMNAYLYNSQAVPSGMQVVAADSGAVMQRLVLRGTAPGSDHYETEVALVPALRKVVFRNRYDKRPPVNLEGVDFVFDFTLPGAAVTYEIPFGAVRLFEDELSGFRVKHYATGKWLRLSTSDTDVVLALREVAVQGYPSGTMDGRVRLLASFNGKESVYRAGTGPLTAAFALTTGIEEGDDAAATRFAYGFDTPLHVRVLPADQNGPLPEDQWSLLRLEGADLLLTTVKRAEEGSGLVARLYNPGSEAVAVRLVSGLPLLSAGLTNLLEEDRAPLAVEDGAVWLTLDPRAVTTFRLDVATPVGVEPEGGVPAAARAGDPYPNPSGAAVALPITVAEACRVQARVYDLLGRRVALLTDAMYSPGTHTIRWDGRDSRGLPVAAGVYYCTIDFGVGATGRRETRTLVRIP